VEVLNKQTYNLSHKAYPYFVYLFVIRELTAWLHFIKDNVTNFGYTG